VCFTVVTFSVYLGHINGQQTTPILFFIVLGYCFVNCIILVGSFMVTMSKTCTDILGSLGGPLGDSQEGTASISRPTEPAVMYESGDGGGCIMSVQE